MLINIADEIYIEGRGKILVVYQEHNPDITNLVELLHQNIELPDGRKFLVRAVEHFKCWHDCVPKNVGLVVREIS